jgi:hypothetical protein
MADYRLNVSQWLFHYRGRVTADYEPLCCGTQLSFNAPEHRGKETCVNGHEISKPLSWDVEKDWDADRLKAWARDGWPDPGPAQFDQEEDVTDRTMIIFLDGMRNPYNPEKWEVEPAKQGDRLFDDQDELIAECNRG